MDSVSFLYIYMLPALVHALLLYIIHSHIAPSIVETRRPWWDYTTSSSSRSSCRYWSPARRDERPSRCSGSPQVTGRGRWWRMLEKFSGLTSRDRRNWVCITTSPIAWVREAPILTITDNPNPVLRHGHGCSRLQLPSLASIHPLSRSIPLSLLQGKMITELL